MLEPHHKKQLLKAMGQASQAVMAIYESSDFGVEHKGDGSPLTRADKAAHEILTSTIKKLGMAYPVISEEDEAHGHINREQAFWLVDPLDGTKEFINKNDQFTLNIGLIANRKPAWGLVAAPALERMWVGDCLQRQAYVIKENGEVEAIRVRAQPRDGLSLVGSRSHASPKEQALAEHLPIKETIALGSSLKFCRIAEGRADFYPRAGRTMEWDTAAGQAVLVAAGGLILNWDGSDFLYGKTGFVNDHGFIATASTAYLHGI